MLMCHEDTYTGCDWYGCDEKCPNTKVLITQRSEIIQDGNAVTCTSGANKLCCDPPDGSNSWPVDPEDLFKYPDEENVSYYYSVQESSNDEGGNLTQFYYPGQHFSKLF